MDFATQLMIVLGFVSAVTAVVFFMFTTLVLRPWLRARQGGAPLHVRRLVHMLFLRANVDAVTDAWIMSRKADLSVALSDLEMHDIAGGNVRRVIIAAIGSQKSGVNLSLSQVMAMDLGGNDPVEGVQGMMRAQEVRRRNEAGQVDEAKASTLVGAQGEVTSAITAPGVVSIDGVLVSAISRNGFVPTGASVRVVDSKGNVVVVENMDARK